MQGYTENTPRADEIVQGKSRLSVPPADPYEPIAVGDNDPRLDEEVSPHTDLASFPLTGSVGVIYVDETTNFLYRWDGAAYVQVGGGGGGGHVIIDQTNTPLPQQPNLQFIGAVNVTDDNTNSKTVVEILAQFSQLQDEDNNLLTVEPTTKFVGHDVVNDSINNKNIVNRQHESQYRFEIVTTIDQDIWLNNSTIFKIVKSAGVDTAEYRIGVGAWVPITFTGNTWTGTLNITAAQVLSWRITYTGGFTTAALIVQHKRTL